MTSGVYIRTEETRKSLSKSSKRVWANPEHHKNPDFIEVNGKKEVVEIFGTYWHSGLYGKKVLYKKTYKGTIEHYNKYGFKCHIFWDDEINERNILDKLKR